MNKIFDIFKIFKSFKVPLYGGGNIYNNILTNGSFKNDKQGWSEYNSLPSFSGDDALIPYGSMNSSLLQAVCLPEIGRYRMDINVKSTTSLAFGILFKRGTDFQFPMDNLGPGLQTTFVDITEAGMYYFGFGTRPVGESVFADVNLRFVGDNISDDFVNGDFKAYDYGWSPYNTLPIYNGSSASIEGYTKLSFIYQLVCAKQGAMEVIVNISSTTSSGFVIISNMDNNLVKTIDNLQPGEHTITVPVNEDNEFYIIGIGSNEGGKTNYKSITVDLCAKYSGELLYNYSFGCGDDGWGFDPAYPATITDNGDGSLHLKTDSNFGSLVPVINTPFAWNTYVIECKVRNVVGTGKMSLRRINNAWFNSPDITTDGVHTFEYTGNIKEVHVGANGDTNFEADYDYISLKLKT